MRCAILLLSAAWLLGAQTKPPGPVNPTAPPPPSATIHGVIKDESTRQPATDFEISATTLEMHDIAGVQRTVVMGMAVRNTDDEGHYEITGVKPGTVRVTASRVHGTGVTHTVQIADGQDLTVDFLVPGNPAISGKVRNEKGEPAVDAFVYLIQSDYNGGVLQRSKIGLKVADEDGNYTFDALLETGRAYYVLVDRDLPEEVAGHGPVPLDQREPIEAPTYYGNVTSLDAATRIVLRPGERHEQTDIKLRTAMHYCVDGKLDTTLQQAPEAVAIQERGLSALPRVHISAAEDGTFGVCGLTPGLYAASSGGGYAEFTIANADVHKVRVDANTATVHLNLSRDGDPPPMPTMEAYRAFLAEQVPPEIWAKMPPDVRDKWLDEMAEDRRKRSGEVRGSEMRVEIGFRGSILEAAPFDGPYGSVAAGDRALRVSVPPGSYVEELTYNGVAVTNNMLHLAPGTTGTLRVVAAQGSGKIEFQVSDADGNPVSDASVVLLPRSANSPAAISAMANIVESGPDGKASLSEIAPGKYRALAFARMYRQNPEDLEKVVLMLFKAQEIDLDKGATVQVKLPAMTLQ